MSNYTMTDKIEASSIKIELQAISYVDKIKTITLAINSPYLKHAIV